MNTHDSQFVEKTMHHVVSLEKRRSTLFLLIVRTALITLGLIAVVLCGAVVYQLYTQGSFDVLSILSEDRDIIMEYWSDVTLIFMAEFPTEYIPALLIAVGVAIYVYLYTIGSRKRSKRALDSIRSLEKKKSRVSP